MLPRILEIQLHWRNLIRYITEIELGEELYIGTEPRYRVLKRQGYRVLVLEKDLFFYKIDEENKKVVIYAVVDGRQDYLNIIRGL